MLEHHAAALVLRMCGDAGRYDMCAIPLCNTTIMCVQYHYDMCAIHLRTISHRSCVVVLRDSCFAALVVLRGLCVVAMVKNTEMLWTAKKIDSFLAKMPKPQKFSDASLDSRAQIDETALKVVIRMMMEQPDRILPTKGGLESNTLGASRAELKGSGERWDNEIKLVRKIPDWWWVEWVVEASAGHLSKAVVRAIIKKDAEEFENLVFFALQLPKSAVLPKPCQVRKVCSRTMTQRAALVGHRMKLIYKSINGTGVINWGKSGCYSFVWGKEGRAEELHHIAGAKVAIPEHVHITTAFELRDNYSDRLANVFLDLKPPQTYVLADFFPEKVGPNTDNMVVKPADKVWLDLAEEARAVVETQEAAAEKGSIKGDINALADLKKEKAKAFTAKARMVRKENTANRKKMKVVHLDAGA